MTTTVCPICNHPTRYPRSNPSAWECTFCGTRGITTGNIQLDKYGSSIQYTAGGLKYDDGKLQYGLIPPIATKSLAQVLTFGAAKYAPNSWQTVQDGERRYLDALYRHLEAYRIGESTDSESGLSHLAHAITNVAFLLHFEQEKATNAINANRTT